MQINIVNGNNEKIGSVELRDEVFGGLVKSDLIWEAVVQATGRARVGEIRNPLWRKGGTVFGPQPRSYAYDLPKKVNRGALRAALAQKFSDGSVIVIDRLESAEGKTKDTAALLKRLGASGKTLIIDVKPDEGFALSARNLAAVRLVPSGRITARDVMDTTHVIATRDAIEKLQEALG
jgi:large subunit ribosomal protein L4